MQTYNELLPHLWFAREIDDPPRMLIYDNLAFIRNINPRNVSPDYRASMLELTKDKTVVVVPPHQFNYLWEQACKQADETGTKHYEHMLVALTMYKLEGSLGLDPP